MSRRIGKWFRRGPGSVARMPGCASALAAVIAVGLWAGVGESLGSPQSSSTSRAGIVVGPVPGSSGADGSAAVRLCTGDYPTRRDPSNPLMLTKPPGADQLRGADLFVDGPAHGAAAGAIARLVGRSPGSYPDDYSYQQFAADLSTSGFALFG